MGDHTYQVSISGLWLVSQHVQKAGGQGGLAIDCFREVGQKYGSYINLSLPHDAMS